MEHVSARVVLCIPGQTCLSAGHAGYNSDKEFSPKLEAKKGG